MVVAARGERRVRPKGRMMWSLEVELELITLVEVGDGIPPRFRPTKKEKKKV